MEEDVAEAGMEGVLQETGRKHGWRIILSMDALSMFLELSAVCIEAGVVTCGIYISTYLWTER